MLAPAKTPPGVIARLNREINAILGRADVTQRLAAEGAIPSQLSAEAFSASVRTEIANWRKIVKELKIPLE